MHLTLLTVALPAGQGLKQVGELVVAFGLCSLIGLEREWRQKAAGLRTHTLVGTGAALLVLVSKYGFGDVLGPHVVLDPSRVAAGLASGIGFIGGGLVFVRGDTVRGLTTAAVVWISAAVGIACGSGLVLLACIVTAMHFIVMFLYPMITARLPRSRHTAFAVEVTYQDGRGVLRDILAAATELGYTVARFETHQLDHDTDVAVTLEVAGQPTVHPLAAGLDDLSGVVEVSAKDLEST